MKFVTITIQATVPDNMECDQVAHCVNQMLDVGQADAFDTVADQNLEQAARDEAELASRIDHGQPSVVMVNVSDLQLLEELLSLTEEHLSGMSSDELKIWKRISAVVADRCELGL